MYIHSCNDLCGFDSNPLLWLTLNSNKNMATLIVFVNFEELECLRTHFKFNNNMSVLSHQHDTCWCKKSWAKAKLVESWKPKCNKNVYGPHATLNTLLMCFQILKSKCEVVFPWNRNHVFGMPCFWSDCEHQVWPTTHQILIILKLEVVMNTSLVPVQSCLN